MKRSRSLLALLILIPVIAACGSASASPPPPTAAAKPTAVPADLVLHAADLPGGYIAVAKNTGEVSLAVELKGDSTAARRADRAAFRGGYSSQFATNLGGVLSESLQYGTRSAATTVGTDHTSLRGLIRALHGHMTAVPPTAPGTNRLLIFGSEAIGSVHIPAYVYTWQHGTVLAGVLVYGRGVTPEAVIALANHQNSRMQNAGL